MEILDQVSYFFSDQVSVAMSLATRTLAIAVANCSGMRLGGGTTLAAGILVRSSDVGLHLSASHVMICLQE